MHTIKHLVVLLYDESPDPRPLTNFGVTLGKETQPFTGLNDQVTQLERRCRMINGNRPHDSFKVREKGVLENYFEIHSLSRART